MWSFITSETRAGAEGYLGVESDRWGWGGGGGGGGFEAGVAIIQKKKKLGVSNTPYDGGRWVTDGGWWVTDGGWWVTDGGWWVTDGGWWVTDGGWWVATKHQRVAALVKKKKRLSVLMATPGGGGGFEVMPHREPRDPPKRSLRCVQ